MKMIMGLLLVTFACFPAWSQQRRGGHAIERIHAAKIAYITDRLHLNSSQSAPFVVIYNEYEEEIKKSRREVLGKYKGMKPEEADDETARQFIDDNLDYQQKLLDIKRKYNDRFLKVITNKQLAELHQAEREFKQLLMERLKNRKEGSNRANLRR